MANESILLGLSASEQSRNAAELCWALAERANARVLAQHVVDSQGTWDLLGHDRPGFMGSGPVVAVHEATVDALRSMGRKLTEAYDTHAAAHKISSESVIDEGSPVREICRRAPAHDLVVIGHSPSPLDSPETERPKRARFSVAESLAHECPRPLLVVQEHCEPWSKMRIVLSLKHINEQYINSALALAATLTLEPQVIGLASGIHEEERASFVSDLRKSNRSLVDLTIRVKQITDYVLDEGTCSWWTCEDDIEWDALPDTLIVMPTRMLANRRITVYGSSPDYFIRHLRLPSILLMPEESPYHARPQPEQTQQAPESSTR